MKMDVQYPHEDQKQGLFGPKGEVSQAGIMPQASQDLNKINTRIRIYEGRFLDLAKKLAMVEQNQLSGQKKNVNDIRSIAGDVLELKRAISEIKNKILLIMKEMQFLGKKEDVDLLKKYLEYWEPVRFVTANQVDRMIEDALDKRFKSKEPGTLGERLGRN